VTKESRVIKVNVETEDPKVNQDPRDLMVFRDKMGHPENQEKRVKLEQLVHRVKKELQVIRESLV